MEKLGSTTFVSQILLVMQRGLIILTVLLMAFSVSNAQLNMGKVKNIFGSKKESGTLDQHINNLRKFGKTPIFSGSPSEVKIATYIGQQYQALLYKPHFGRYVHRFSIDKKSNLSEDSYIKIFNKKLAVGSEVVIPPFSGTGTFYAQALPGMPEPDNLWFIKFTDVGVELNNKHSNGLDKMYEQAKDAFNKGAEAVMFVNNDGTSSDFTNSFLDKKSPLAKPIFILNHAAYKEYIIKEARGKEWINIDYNFAKVKRRAEGHNVIGYWQNRTPLNIVIAARLDDLQGKGDNISGLAALLQVAEGINATRPKKYNYILVGLSGTNDERKGAEDLIKKLKLTKENTSAMIHIDDVGALNNNKNELFISGVGTSPDWELVLGSFARNFSLQKLQSGEIGDENHRSFYNIGIPAINIFTKRTDKRFNKAGIEKVTASIADIIMEMDNLPKFKFIKTKAMADIKKMNFNVSMGITPDNAFKGAGLLIGQVRKSSPAFNADILSGDILIRMADYDIRDVNDYVRELAKYKKGDRLMIKVKRDGVDKQIILAFD